MSTQAPQARLSPSRRTPFPCRRHSLLPSLPQVPLDERIIFSGNLFQYQEDNKKWRNRFSLVPHNYGLVLYENKVVRPPPHPASGARTEPRAPPGPRRVFPFSSASRSPSCAPPQ